MWDDVGLRSSLCLGWPGQETGLSGFPVGCTRSPGITQPLPALSRTVDNHLAVQLQHGAQTGALFWCKTNSSSSVCKIVGAALGPSCMSVSCLWMAPWRTPLKPASCCSPVGVLDPMSEQGTALGEISESMVAFRETRVRHGWHIFKFLLASCAKLVV